MATYRRIVMVKQCKHCGKEFIAGAGAGTRKRDSQYCCKHCRGKARHKRWASKYMIPVTKTCPTCGVQFIAGGGGATRMSNAIYCSIKCLDKEMIRRIRERNPNYREHAISMRRAWEKKNREYLTLRHRIWVNNNKERQRKADRDRESTESILKHLALSTIIN